MAKYRRGKKMQPAVMTIFVNTPVVQPGATGEFTCDLSQLASLVNRRFYRQGLNWSVAGFKVFTSGTGSVTVKKLPNTWVMSNAWEKSFRTWQKMNEEALAESESIRPKFMDFKIYADATHHADGFGANLLPLDGQLPVAQQYTAGEWEPSKVMIPLATPADPTATADRELIAVGGNYPGAGASGLNAVSVIDGYAASRGLPNVLDPNVPADSENASGNVPTNWMAAIFNEGTDQTTDILDVLIDENNIAPYPFENDGVHTDTMYPGGANQAPSLQIHDITGITGTTIGGNSFIKGGNFPCGLVRFDWSVSATAETSANLAIQIDLVPGHHRGYLCEPMTEM